MDVLRVFSGDGLRFLLDKIPYPIIIHQEGTITYVNMAAVHMSKVKDRSLLIGTSLISLIDEDSREKAIRYIKNKQEYDSEVFRVKDINMGIYDVEVMKSYVNLNDETHSLLVIKDITAYMKELEDAARIQRHTMTRFPDLPEGLGFRYSYKPFKVVSGDFFFVNRFSESCIIGILGDVKGKGLSAALNTSALKSLFYEVSDVSENTEYMAHSLNHGVQRLLNEEYVAAIIFKLDLKEKTLSLTGAGITEFLIKPLDGHLQRHLIQGPFLGMLDKDMFEHVNYDFNLGDEIYLYTDGIELYEDHDHIKMIDESGDFMGRCRQLDSFAEKQPIDDVTWLAFKYEGEGFDG